MPSMKASPEGLVQIKQAIAEKEWRVHDSRWLVAASKLLQPNGDWPLDGPYAYGCSLQTWERFLRGIAIRDRTFLAFCQVLDVSAQAVAEPNLQASARNPNQLNASRQKVEKMACPPVRELSARIASLERRMGQLESYVGFNTEG